MTPAPWSFEYDPCKGKDPFTGETYGQDFPITGNVPGMSLDGDGDYKPCFCRVKFAPSVSLEEAREMVKLMVAAPVMFQALQEIAARGPVPGHETAGALLLRLVGSQATARQALETAKPAPEPKPAKQTYRFTFRNTSWTADFASDDEALTYATEADDEGKVIAQKRIAGTWHGWDAESQSWK